jgi:predicted DNA-binding WGR domain protein
LWRCNFHRIVCKIFTLITLVHHHVEKLSFYRLDVGYNLFGEYSLVREWGSNGQNGVHRITWFSNLREAAAAADKWHMMVSNKGYQLTEKLVGAADET